jgi:hypothetical protein
MKDWIQQHFPQTKQQIRSDSVTIKHNLTPLVIEFFFKLILIYKFIFFLGFYHKNVQVFLAVMTCLDDNQVKKTQ